MGVVPLLPQVDNKGPSLLIGKTDQGSWFGAFNPIGWASREDYRDSLQAFLFCWPRQPDADSVEILPKARDSGPNASRDSDHHCGTQRVLRRYHDARAGWGPRGGDL